MFFKCLDITDLSFENRSAICDRLSQKVSPSKRTSTVVLPSGVTKISIGSFKIIVFSGGSRQKKHACHPSAKGSYPGGSNSLLLTRKGKITDKLFSREVKNTGSLGYYEQYFMRKKIMLDQPPTGLNPDGRDGKKDGLDGG